MTPEEEFEDALAGPLSEDDPVPPDTDTAERWMAHLRALERRKAEYLEVHRAAVARLNERRDMVIGPIDIEIETYQEGLQTYHEMVFATDDTRTKIDLPSGTLRSGMWGGEKVWTVKDRAVYTAWLMEHAPEAVKLVDPEPKLNEAKKAIIKMMNRISDGKVCLADGTVVPGLEITDRDRAFKVEPSE